MTLSLPLGHKLDAEWRFRFIEKRNFHGSMEMSFFGMPFYILGVCPENRDESNGDGILKLWLQFIPIFGVLHLQLLKGHTTKKDIPMFLICIDSLQKGMKLRKTSPCSLPHLIS
jgi:hypothetical protein